MFLIYTHDKKQIVLLLNETALKKNTLQSIAEQIILIRKKLVYLAIRNWMPFCEY